MKKPFEKQSTQRDRSLNQFQGLPRENIFLEDVDGGSDTMIQAIKLDQAAELAQDQALTREPSLVDQAGTTWRTSLSKTPDDKEDKKDACCRLAQQARHSFLIACRESSTDDDNESYFAASIDRIVELWGYSIYRDLPFRDLLAALEVALKNKTIEEITEQQKDAVKRAFQTLSKWHITTDEVSLILGQFASVGIDLSAPVRPKVVRKIKKITIEYEE